MLLDGSTKRCAFLETATAELQLQDRVRVVASRAEEAARTGLRGAFDLVVARSFGPAAVTAECGGPFLKLGGRLVVAEPPGGDPGRWDPTGLSELGLQLDRGSDAGTSFQALRQVSACPDRYPRRVGIPAKRPLF